MVTHSWPWERSLRSPDPTAWGPIIEVQLRDARGAFQKIRAIVDSGAPLCVFGVRAAELLGLDWACGFERTIGRFSGQPVTIRVLEVELRLGKAMPTRIPIGFTDKPDWPNLIGRLGFFDAHRITFDPVRRETRVQGPFGKWGEN
ncbi:MAG: hypothetical protein ACKVS9_07750 [Phycisphaerae bacterium]